MPVVRPTATRAPYPLVLSTGQPASPARARGRVKRIGRRRLSLAGEMAAASAGPRSSIAGRQPAGPESEGSGAMIDTDLEVRHAIYEHFVTTGEAPTASGLASTLGPGSRDIVAALQRLFERRLLVLASDREQILMAPPFSGVPTQHRVIVGGRGYFANSAWDPLGAPWDGGPGGAKRAGPIPLRAKPGATGHRGPRSGSRPGTVCHPLRSAGEPLVARHRLHVKDDALLPVGRTRERVVPGERSAETAPRHPPAALAAECGVVRQSADAGGG